MLDGGDGGDGGDGDHGGHDGDENDGLMIARVGGRRDRNGPQWTAGK